MKELLSKVMKRAWEIKKEEDRRMEQTYVLHKWSLPIKREHSADFGICLKMAWREVKKEEAKKNLSLDVLKRIASETVKEIGYDKYNTIDWKKGEHDRTYIELVSFKDRRVAVKKCGYWDNKANKYVAEEAWSRKVFDLLA